MASASLINILEKLGGPKFATEDLEWIADIPAGKHLLDFLSKQTTGEVALKEIGLEKEEADMWHRAMQAKLVVEDPPSFTPTTAVELPRTPLDYIPPSVLRSQLGDIEKEQALLDRHVKTLNRRIELEKNAISADKRSLKAISTAQDETSSSISHLKEQLSELSMQGQADSTISSALQGASGLVNKYSGTDGEECHHSYLHTAELSALLKTFANMSSNLRRLCSARFQTESNDPLADKDAIEAEARRLASSIRVLEDQHVEIALADECERLERGESVDTLLSRTAESPDTEDTSEGSWVEAVIEQAWRNEQAAELRLRITFLEQLADVLQNELLPPLALIHSSLSISEASVDDAQVAVQVLVDELDDMVSDLNAAASTQPQQQQQASTFDDHVKKLLRKLRHLRPTDTPALVLADHTDVLSELSAIRARHTRAHEATTALCTTISAHLKSLAAPTQEYLAALTTHAPMPSSRPLAPPRCIRDQTSRAHAQIDAAKHALAMMPEDLTGDSRTRRKLDAFVATFGRA